MSKKMWHKIFKSKSTKQQQQQLNNKINKRHSRGIYEDYQQLSELLNGEKTQVVRFCSENENENENELANCNTANSNINVFEQQPQQSSFNPALISEAQQLQQQQQQQTQQLSTFSRVRNTFSLRRNNNNSNSNNKKQSSNAKTCESMPPPTPTIVGVAQLQRVLIIVNKIDVTAATVATATVATAAATNNNNNNATNSANHLHVNPTAAFQSTTMSSDGGEDELLPPPPGPLTTGLSVPVPEYGGGTSNLTPCPNCSRTFNVNALRKHIVVCEKMASKKRKVFDSSRQRREGTSLSTYVLPKNFGLPNAEKAPGVHTPPSTSREASTLASGPQHSLQKVAPAAASAAAVASPASSNRKSQINTGRNSMRRHAVECEPDGGAAAAAATPPPVAAPPQRRSVRRVKDPASERCPHCDRTFNPKAFDRHVEWCKEKALQASMKGTNVVETSKAKERMEARKQYRPPNLKTKRSINREKYSGGAEDQYEAEMVAPKQNATALSSLMTSSVHSDSQLSSHRNTQQYTKVNRPGTPSLIPVPKAASPSTITQNRVNLRMPDEDPTGSLQEQRYVNPKRKSRETCQEIDMAVARLRRSPTGEGVQVATLNCVEAAPLQPVRSRKALPHRPKVEISDKLAGSPQVAMTFDELNGIIKRKGGANICNIKMDIDEQIMKALPKQVRLAQRRIRTPDSPNIQLRTFEGPKGENGYENSDGQLYGIPSGVYSGSEDENNSACGEIKIKMETIRTVCRPKKRTQLPNIVNNSEPMRALPIPELKHSLESLSHTLMPCLELSNGSKEHYKENQDGDDDEFMDMEDYDEAEADAEVGRLLSKAKLLEQPFDDEIDDLAEMIQFDEVDEKQEEQQSMKLPSMRKQHSNVSRRLVLLEQDEEGTMYIKAPPTPNKRHSPVLNSGLSPNAGDKYDPFLSAKRQLEELCSPNTPPDNELQANTTPTASMSTSLTNALGKLHVATPNTPTTTTKATPPSNFRRTSSLRGPRRTPLLPSRPLFATNYRPTIQRGLSDEGPISSNFLKPEEYDEMPVRAACGNDFHSPRVVRRDTSASNRKQQIKLPLSGAVESESATTPKTPVRNVAKTDSLAVFLNYEHELEQLNAKAAEIAANSKELSSKELKDKSNNLSKQNSAKNLSTNPNIGQLPPLTLPICPAVTKENNENVSHNFATPLRLEPISKVATPQLSSATPNSSSSGTALPIKLESIFGGSRLGDYIDPKLINACDNLNVQQSSTGSSDASSTPQQLSQSRSSSQSTITTGQDQRRHSGEARNLLKRKMRLGRNQFLYDASPEEAYTTSGSCADDEANRSSLEYDEQCWQQQQKQLLSNSVNMPMPTLPILPTFDDFDFEEFLSSFENENDEEQFPLFRDCREFLLNRTTSRQRSFQKATSTSTPQTQSQFQAQLPTTTTTTTATQRPATTANCSQFITPSKSHFYTPSKDNNALRSDSNISSSGGSMQSAQNSSGSYKTPPGSNCYTAAFNSSAERLQRQQSNISSGGSSFNGENIQNSMEDSHKREIFICIETEPNAQGLSPISPDSLRHMVGNSQTPIDVLHIENGNEPEHAKFSKISDNEDQIEAGLDDETSRLLYKKRLISTPSAAAVATPNVEANNAKNVIEKMRSDFKQLGEEVSASVRRDILQRHEQAQQQQQQQQMQAQQDLKVSSPMSPSPSGDSDELSSLDGYPMSSSQSSRRGVSSKLSSDSAYGSTNSPYSLSRQRSSELQPNNTPRSQNQMRPHTASGALASSGKQNCTMINASTQAQTNYGTLKARQRMFGGGGGGGGDGPGATGDGCAEFSSSSSEQSLPANMQQQNTNYNYQQQQQQKAYNNNSSYELNAQNLNNNNNIGGITPTTSQHSLLSNNSNGSSNMSASMKMSKFCHECGGKFIIEHAKFCMECGVKRVVL